MARTLFCFPNVYHGPLEDIPGGKVGKFTFILPHTAFSTERMPTSRVGFSTCLVSSRDEIPGDDAEK